MRSLSVPVLVAASITVVVGLLTNEGFPGYVVGAGLALALWLMLFFASSRPPQRLAVAPMPYAGAAVLALALGYLLFWFGDDNAAWWAPGFIVAGVLTSTRFATTASAGTGTDTEKSGATSDRR